MHEVDAYKDRFFHPNMNHCFLKVLEIVITDTSMSGYKIMKFTVSPEKWENLKPQPCGIDLAITWSLQHGLGLRFSL